jgi:hypothetical protein
MLRKMKIYINTVRKIWVVICWNIFSSLPLPLLARAVYLKGGLMYPYSGLPAKGTFGKGLIN